MNNWVKDIIGTDKAMIGLCHLPALPGDPRYDKDGGMEKVFEITRKEVLALQGGGIDAIQFTNEFSMPYAAVAKAETVAAMAYLIGRLTPEITVPFGTNCIMDPVATIGLCAAVGAKWTRGTYHGAWATPSGLTSGDSSEIYRLRHNLGADDVKLVHYINPESSADAGGRDFIDAFRAHYFLNQPDAIGVAGLVAGQSADSSLLRRTREAFPEAVVFVVTGVKAETVEMQMEFANAAFVGTSLKEDGVFTNGIDQERVARLMDKVRSIR